MRTLVPDAGVAVAWYVAARFSRPAREWQAQLLAARVRMIAPSLHYWEFANVLRTLVRRAELDGPLAADIHALHVRAPIERWFVEGDAQQKRGFPGRQLTVL